MKIYGNDGNLIFGEQNAEILTQNSNILEVKLTNGDIYRVNVVGSNADDVFVSNVEMILDNTDAVIGDKRYKTVKIGTSIWLAENLDYEIEGSYYYNDDKLTYSKFGRLYTWEAVNNISIPGWHVPSKDEYDALVDYAGGGTNGGKELKSTNYWLGTAGNGVNSLGFNGVPTGNRDSSGNYANFGYNGYYWTNEAATSSNSYSLNLFGNNDTCSIGAFDKTKARALRLIKD